MSVPLRVAIIGGGVSGLAAARAFRARGHEVLGIERLDDFGGVWHPSRSYPGVRTQSPRDLYRYIDQAMPDSAPEWPTGPEVHAYLCDYGERNALRSCFRFGATVEGMRRPEGGRGWTLRIQQGDVLTDERVDFVAVCTGQFSDPRRLEVPGAEAFEGGGGQRLHSSEVTRAELLVDRDVVVVGGSKSATDLAVLAHEQGARSVQLAYRRDVWRAPYTIGGINFKHLLYMRAQEIQFPAWRGVGLPRPLDALLRAAAWLNFRGLEWALRLQLGLGRHGMIPDTRIEDDASCSLPIVTPGFFEALRAGRIVAHRSPPARLEPGAVLLESGARLPCDLLVMATGWRLGHPFLPPEVTERLIAADGLYRLYRWAVCPEVPDLGFVGANSSFCTVLSSDLIARWLVRFAEGRLARQLTVQEMQSDVERLMTWRREVRPAAGVYGGQCVAPFHFRHFDELLEDMGARQTRPGNPLRAWFTYPRAEDYRRFLASIPDDA